MYSRSYATFENINTAKLSPELKRNSRGGNTQAIPVKSFSDDSAFERFNNLGKSKIMNDEKNDNFEEDLTDKQTSREIESNNTEIDILHEVEASESNVSIKEIFKDQTKKEKANSISLFSEFHKLINIIEDDWFVLILALAMLFFGANETNDKLTPIALLAIMFI